MGYRDVSESLRSYRERIARELEDANLAAEQASELAAKARVLQKELAETDNLLAKLGDNRRALPLLEDIRVAAPCPAKWEEMVGDERVRFCGQCEKNVYNLSSLPRAEAEALVAAREGKMCVRFYRRADGSVLTSDCPVGVKRRRRRRGAMAAVGGGLMAVAAALGLEQTSDRPTTGAMQPLQGEFVTQGLVAPPQVRGSVAAPAPPPTMGKPATGRAK